MSETTDKPLTISLRADWGTGPFCATIGDEGPDGYDSSDIGDVVPLGNELLADVAARDGRSQVTFNEEYPPDSKFATPEDEAAFVAEGRELAQRVKEEVPAGTVVRYGALDNGRWEIVREK